MFFVRRVSLALLITAAGSSGCQAPEPGEEAPDRLESEIVGGKPAAITEAPWQVSLQSRSSDHFCGGSIIADRWILTAQHCVEGTSAKSLKIVAGISKLSERQGAQERAVAEIIAFPGYTDATLGKDIALLRLAEPLDLSTNKARAIELATDSSAHQQAVSPGKVSRITGWGSTKTGSGLPDELQLVEVPLISNQQASDAYRPTIITDDQLAAGYMGQGGKDACQGDSGGPLVVQNPSGSGYLLAGVVSWGRGCALPNYPGLYARVSAFTKWISQNVGAVIPGSDAKVQFSCAAGYTSYGQSVYVVGSSSSLGSWDPDSAIKLEPTRYPTWTGTVSLPAGDIEWKCVKRDEQDPTRLVQWQAGTNNRVTVPNTGEVRTSGSF